MPEEAKRPPALEGIRVLELGDFIAGPTAGRLMAEFGAEVIKIERPGTGDQVRQWRLYGDDVSMLWRTLARNKKSVTVDLSRAEGAKVIRTLARRCHVLIENFRPGKLESWGIGPDVLRQENPSLVIVRLSGFGQSGPYRDRAGFGGVAEAMGGLRGITGYPDRPPTRVGISIGDTLAGLYAVIGALMALLHAHRTGEQRGETIDVALTEAVLAVMESLIPEYSAYGVVRKRMGNRIDGVTPSNAYPCRDGEWVIIGGNTDSIFRRLMSVIGRPDLGADPGLSSNESRNRRAEELDSAVTEWTRGRSVADAVTALVREGVPAGPVYNAARIVSDAQFLARSMVIEDTAAVHGQPREVLFPGIVPKLELHPGEHRWLGPGLGAHTSEVLLNLAGLSSHEIKELADKGVI
jgi:formyl-CoA transferase